jgi:GT2 family glycosyltransferase
MALVSVVIPTYKASQHLLLCVQSIARSELAHVIEVCIYGDGGGDASREAIAHSAHILETAGIKCSSYYNPENLGNTPAVNRAAALAHGQWLFFCNDDMVFPRSWLQKCEPLLKSGQIVSVACIEPPVHGHTPSKYFYAADLGIDPTSFNLIALDHYIESVSECGPSEQTGVHYPFFVERQVFERLGGADEQFSGPYHDPDLFLRFRNSGFTMIRTRRCALYHFSGVSLRFANTPVKKQKRKKSKRWILEENKARLNFIRKWGAKPKSKFGDVPKTKATTEFNWNTEPITQKTKVRLLLLWETVRAKVRTLRYS